MESDRSVVTNNLSALGVTEIRPLTETNINADLTTSEREITALEAEIFSDPSAKDNEETIETLDAQIAACTALRNGLRKSQMESLATIETSQKTLEQYGDVWRSTGDRIEDLQALAEITVRQLSAAKAALADAENKTSEAHQALDTQRTRLAQAVAFRDNSQRNLHNLQSRQEHLLIGWKTSLPGLPDGALLLREKERIDLDLSRVQETENERRALAESFRAWLDDEELKACEERIRNQIELMNCTTEEEVTPHLLRQTLLAGRSLERVQEVKQKVEDVVSSLQSEADTYAEEVLRPLNSTIQKFVRVLISRADASVIYRAHHHADRSELKPGIWFFDEVSEGRIVEMNPNLYFSEGELSALSVSALLAASTRFRWSRWKALLLDDPLQHSDVIHASVFVDLLSDLVRHLDYQVILSTHDSNEASFFARKLESTRVPFKICEFSPRGPEGLISEVA